MTDFEIGDLIKLKPHVENDSFIGVGFGLISDIMRRPIPDAPSHNHFGYYEIHFAEERCWFEQKDIDLILKIR